MVIRDFDEIAVYRLDRINVDELIAGQGQGEEGLAGFDPVAVGF
ncbi:hypothetical protein HRbin07_00396 [bacterium HR07]|nr:hypothetical protein HRbin07_00396 [bacterium HR07]